MVKCSTIVRQILVFILFFFSIELCADSDAAAGSHGNGEQSLGEPEVIESASTLSGKDMNPVVEKNQGKPVPAIEYRNDPLIKGLTEEAMLGFDVLSARQLFDLIVAEVAYECAYKWRPSQKEGATDDSCFDSLCGTNSMCREAAVKIMVDNQRKLLDGH